LCQILNSRPKQIEQCFRDGIDDIYLYRSISYFQVSHVSIFVGVATDKKKKPILAHALADGAASALTPGYIGHESFTELGNIKLKQA
jgi:hypothetical protein